MIVTISKINRTMREGKKGPFESLGIAPEEDNLMDINGDSFVRDGRWLSGFGRKDVTDSWKEGDKVKINLVRVKGKKGDGTDAEFINFKLPEGVEPLVSKADEAKKEEEVDLTNDF
jgi:hypothetical protein